MSIPFSLVDQIGETADYPPIHPGEVLRAEFLEPLDLSGSALAEAIGVPRNRIYAILGGRRSITADTALRLAKYFGTSVPFWLNLQQAHDVQVALDDLEPGTLDRIEPHAV